MTSPQQVANMKVSFGPARSTDTGAWLAVRKPAELKEKKDGLPVSSIFRFFTNRSNPCELDMKELDER